MWVAGISNLLKGITSLLFTFARQVSSPVLLLMTFIVGFRGNLACNTSWCSTTVELVSYLYIADVVLRVGSYI